MARLPMLALVCTLLPALGCSARRELAVDLRTDLAPGAEFDRISVSLDRAPSSFVPSSAYRTYAHPRRVAEYDAIASGHHTVDVVLSLRGMEVASRPVTVRIDDSYIVLVAISRDCRNVGGHPPCPIPGDDPSHTACTGTGECCDPADPECGAPECRLDENCTTAVECVEPHCIGGICSFDARDGFCAAGSVCDPDIGCVAITSPDAGPLDGGDAHPDSPVTEPHDAGDDAVMVGGCGGTASCDDGVACTDDLCVRDACTHTPNDALCPGGVCTPGGPGASATTGCVTGPCAGQPATTVCRPSRGACDPAETCLGTGDPSCPPEAPPPGTCRAATGECDVAELCGAGTDCPTDGFAPGGTPCGTSGHVCDGHGVCIACAAPGATCLGGPCETAMLDCSSGTPICRRTLLPAGRSCRPSAGACDVAEVCDGVTGSCPPDGFASAATTCRPSAGGCDRDERCTGSSATCPANVFVPSGTPCGTQALDACEMRTCDGRSATCPASTPRPAGVQCATATGPCDLPDHCDGVHTTCPSEFRPASFVCRAAVSACDVGERCTGAADWCPSDAFAPAGTVCRVSAAICDAAEVCTGTSATCPADALAPSTLICRASAYECDASEHCTGTSPSCPADLQSADGHRCQDPGSCDTGTYPCCRSGRCSDCCDRDGHSVGPIH